LLRLFAQTFILAKLDLTHCNYAVLCSLWYYGRIFNDFFIANLLLSVMVKNFEDRLGFGKVMAKNKVAPFFPDTVYFGYPTNGIPC